MELTRLVAVPELRLQLRTGDLADARSITWVHTTELVNPAPWLEGGELLLTTGLQIQGADDAKTFVERVVDAGITAVGFGIAPIHETVPAALLEAASRRGLPLIEIPSTTPFIAVSRVVASWWAEEQTALLRRVIVGQRNIAQGALSTTPGSEVVRRLAEEMDCWAMLVGGGTSVIAGSPGPDLERWVREQAHAPRSASTRRSQHSVLLHKVSGRHSTAQLAAGRDIPFSSAERSLVLIAEALLSAAGVWEDRPSENALCGLALELLLDGHVDACWHVAGALYGDRLPPLWRAVAERVSPGEETPSTYPCSPPLLVTTAGSQRIWLIPADQLAEVLHEIERRGHTGGYSDAVSALEAQRAVEDARRALALTRAHGGNRIAGPDDLTGYGPLSLATDDQVRAAEHVLGPLLSEGRGDILVDSLRVWFEEGARWDRAAARLGVHRHTLRQRLESAFKRLDRDMENPRDRLELWASLSLLERRQPCAGSVGGRHVEH